MDYRQHLENILLWGQINAFLVIILIGVIVYSVFIKRPVEYTVLSPSDTTMIKELQKAGQQGWGIANTRRVVDSETGEGVYEFILQK